MESSRRSIDDASPQEWNEASRRIQLKQVPSALAVQVGGDHYKKLGIQPMEYSMANNLDACQHTIVKYVTRFRDKNGLQDLEKAMHTLQLLMDFERSKAAKSQG